MMDKIKYCGTCALRTQDGTGCSLYGIHIDPNVDFCSKHVTSPKTCDICGQFIIIDSIIDMEDGKFYEVCQNCASRFNTCHICDKAAYCDFMENPSPIPKAVMKQVRQGSMVMQTQVRNPERIKITCENGCSCWNKEEKYCCREYKTCGQYKHTYH